MQKTLEDLQNILQDLCLQLLKRHLGTGHVGIDTTCLDNGISKDKIAIDCDSGMLNMSYHVDSVFNILILNTNLGKYKAIPDDAEFLQNKQLTLLYNKDDDKIEISIVDVWNFEITPELEEKYNLCDLKGLFEDLEKLRTDL